MTYREGREIFVPFVVNKRGPNYLGLHIQRLKPLPAVNYHAK